MFVNKIVISKADSCHLLPIITSFTSIVSVEGKVRTVVFAGI